MKRGWIWVKGTVTRFLDNNCSTHAAGLTYFSLLAVVPVLCCILVLAKTCHVDQYAREQIDQRIDHLIANIEDGQNDSLISRLPGFSTEEQQKKRLAAAEFGREARKISDSLFARIDNFDVGTLGWVGFGFLLWTVISSLASVESSFNQIFDVALSRPIWKRAYMYLLIMIVMPVIAAIAMSMPVLNVVKSIIVSTLGTTYLTKWAGDWLIWIIDCYTFRFVVSFLPLALFFALFYWVIPNCRVRFRNAAIGGTATAFAFVVWIKLCAIAQVGIVRSSALYGSFALLPIILAWLYMSWQIVLIGACMVRQLDLQPQR